MIHDSWFMIHENGFISIELMIAIVIIGLLAITGLAAFTSAKVQARDKQRLADISAIQSAVQIYFTENGFYPSGENAQMPSGIADYLDRWPVAPVADGACTKAANQYLYSQKAGGADFALTFCLGQKTNGLSAGNHTINSKQIM